MSCPSWGVRTLVPRPVDGALPAAQREGDEAQERKRWSVTRRILRESSEI